MAGLDDVGLIVKDQFKPVLTFMWVIGAGVAVVAVGAVKTYQVYADQQTALSDLKKDVLELKARDVVATKARAAMAQKLHDALKVGRDRSDLNSDMAKDGMSRKRKDHFSDLLKYRRDEEHRVIAGTGPAPI